MTLTRREELLRPHAVEHAASVERKAQQPPSSLHGLLKWYMDAWAAEVPEDLHRAGVEWDKESGGSLLGTPRWGSAFTRYITGSAYETEGPFEDKNYVRPLRCALAFMAHHRRPLLSRWLFLLGLNNGNWAAVSYRFNTPLELGEVITYAALRECRRAYTPDPRVSVAA